MTAIYGLDCAVFQAKLEIGEGIENYQLVLLVYPMKHSALRLSKNSQLKSAKLFVFNHPFSKRTKRQAKDLPYSSILYKLAA